jgi:isocitrate lyase
VADFQTAVFQWQDGERRVREALPDERLAYDVAPGAPWAWDARVTADAAFSRYMREATDYAGGRRLDPRPAK